jgi:hypothetical protein
LTAEEFGATADVLAEKVARVLELEAFTRIGFRAWHLYPTASKADAFERIESLKLFSIDPELQQRLGQVSDRSHTLVVERPDHMARVALTAFEQRVEIPPSVLDAARGRARDSWKDQKQLMIAKLRAKKIVDAYPADGLLLDIDAYVEEPPYPTGLSVSDFVSSAARDVQEIKKLVLAKS